MPPPPTEVFASRLFLGPALRAQSDGRLVTLVREGYEAAFEEIVRRYGRPLARYAASIVGSRSEDVTQDAFSKALTAIRRDDNEIDLRPWLYRIVRNTALNDLRDRPPTTEILEEAIAAGRGTATEAEEREQLRELVDRLRALPERQRAAIVMRELEGLSHGEIAAALGLSGGAARQVIFRAREALRGGAGMLVPLPLMRLLLEYGPEATAGAGVLAAGGAAGGAGTALKAGAVAAIIAGSLGTGIALQRDHGNADQANAATLSDSPRPSRAARAVGRPASAQDGPLGRSEAADDHGDGHDGGEDHRGRSDGDDSTTRARADDNSGPGGGHQAVETGRGGSGGSSNSGPGSVVGTSGAAGDDDQSGSGDRHGGRSGSSGGSDDSGGSGVSGGTDDNSGPGGGGGTDDNSGSGGDGVTEDHSGPGDGSIVSEPAPTTTTTDGSGSGSSGSSGSGSGDSLDSDSGSSSSGPGGGDSIVP